MPLTFALPWLLTWFSHVIDDIRITARLFDVFITHSSPLVIVYTIAQVILSQHQSIDELLCNDNDTDGFYISVHKHFQV